MGRWRLQEEDGNERWSSALVDMVEEQDTVLFRQVHGVRPWASEDPSSERVWWSDAGVHQNITFPVHPDPVSGMHCWHQKVRVRPALPGDRYADVVVDFARSRAVYRRWLALARPAIGELRRPRGCFASSSPPSTPIGCRPTIGPRGSVGWRSDAVARSTSRSSSTGPRGGLGSRWPVTHCQPGRA